MTLPGLPASSDRSADIGLIVEPAREIVEVRDDDERTVYIVEPVAVSQTIAPTTLAQLTDVADTAPADGQVLTFAAGTGLWAPAAPAGGGGGTDPAVEERLTALEARPIIDSPDDIGAQPAGSYQPAGDYATSSALTLGLAGKAPTVHSHAVSDVAGLQGVLDGKAASTHTHAVADVTGLQSALDGKAAAVHGHAIADVTGLQSALDGKAAAAAPAQAAADAVTAHEQAADPHPQYLTQTEGSALYAPAGEPASAAASAVAAHVAVADPHPQYLTQTEGDGRYATGAALFDWRARRFGCKALTLTPNETAFADPTTIRMTQNRLYSYWLPLPQGATVSSVRLPIADLCSGAGAIRFTVYQEDFALLGSTGDVNAALTGGSANTWRTLALTAPGTVTGNGVYVTAHSLVPSGNAPGLVFGNTTTSMAWTWNDGQHRTAVRVEGLAAPPASLDLSAGLDYIDAMIGVA